MKTNKYVLPGILLSGISLLVAGSDVIPQNVTRRADLEPGRNVIVTAAELEQSEKRPETEPVSECISEEVQSELNRAEESELQSESQLQSELQTEENVIKEQERQKAEALETHSEEDTGKEPVLQLELNEAEDPELQSETAAAEELNAQEKTDAVKEPEQQPEMKEPEEIKKQTDKKEAEDLEAQTETVAAEDPEAQTETVAAEGPEAQLETSSADQSEAQSETNLSGSSEPQSEQENMQESEQQQDAAEDSESQSELHPEIDFAEESELQSEIDTVRKEELRSEQNTEKESEAQSEMNTAEELEPQSETNAAEESELQSELNEVKEAELQSELNETEASEPQSELNETEEPEPRSETNEAKESEPQSETNAVEELEPQSELNEAEEPEPQSEMDAAEEESELQSEENTTDGSDLPLETLAEPESELASDSQAAEEIAAQTESQKPQELVSQEELQEPQESVSQAESQKPQESVSQAESQEPQESASQTEPQKSQESASQTEPQKSQESALQAESSKVQKSVLQTELSNTQTQVSQTEHQEPQESVTQTEAQKEQEPVLQTESGKTQDVSLQTERSPSTEAVSQTELQTAGFSEQQGTSSELSVLPEGDAWYRDADGKLWLREEKEEEVSARIQSQTAAPAEEFLTDGEAPAAAISVEGTVEGDQIYCTEGKISIAVPPDAQSGLKRMSYCIVPSDFDGENVDEKDWKTCREQESLNWDQEGTFCLYVRTEDQVGNVTFSKSSVFCVDQTSPGVTVQGIEDSTANSGSLDIRVECRDDAGSTTLCKAELKGLNNGIVLIPDKAQESDGSIRLVYPDLPQEREYDDIYEMTVQVQDLAGNLTEERIRFSVNRCGSVYDLGEDTREKLQSYYLQEPFELVIYETNVDYIGESRIFCRRDGILQELVKDRDYQVSLNGTEATWKQYRYTISESLMEQDGIYEFLLTSTDLADNSSDTGSQNNRIVFAVDRTPPTALVTGIEPEGIYQTDRKTVKLLASDNVCLSKVWLYRDGELWKSFAGSEFGENGGEMTLELEEKDAWQTFQVCLEDASGNRYESQEIPFYLSSGAEAGKIPEYQGTLQSQRKKTAGITLFWSGAAAFAASLAYCILTAVTGLRSFPRKKRKR